MKTTKEAADFLQVSQRRITALIQSGTLEAEKKGPLWFIDEDSLVRYASTVKKQGGRPKKGSHPQEFRFIFKNRTHDIAEVIYDATAKEFTSIGPLIDKERAPLGTSQLKGSLSVSSFNIWWRNRGIPAQRPGIEEALSDMGLDLPVELTIKNLGLSLSDQYWICPEKTDLAWQNLNFFNNDFEDIEIMSTSSKRSTTEDILKHPDNTSEGVLPKHWIISKGKRFLLKGGLHNDQEPFNEVAATALHKRLLNTHDYVPYHLDFLNGKPASSCPLFLTDQEEFIPALYVSRISKQAGHHSDYQHYIECCISLGIAGVEAFLSRMIVCDDILANTDRHWRNFGIIRNVDTLECRVAPIFDSGTSLWCDKSDFDLNHGDFKIESKQFKPDLGKQLLLAHDISWIDTDALTGYLDEACAILLQNEKLHERIPRIKQGLEERLERMISIRKYL